MNEVARARNYDRIAEFVSGYLKNVEELGGKHEAISYLLKEVRANGFSFGGSLVGFEWFLEKRGFEIERIATKRGGAIRTTYVSLKKEER